MKITKLFCILMTAAMLVMPVAGCGSGGSETTTAAMTETAETAAATTAETETTTAVTTAATTAAAAETLTESASPASGGGEITYEEGTSERDGIVNTTAADKVLLVVSFGTSFNQSRYLTIGGIEERLRQTYTGYQIRRAFTSQIIIDKLARREGLNIDNVDTAMSRLVLDKVKEVVIQPTTVMTGFEYDDIIKEVMPYADKFDSFKIGKPLLVDEADYNDVADIIVSETSKYRADGTAIVFMGHGTEHAANATYGKLQDVLWAKGYGDYLIGTVEGEPELDDVRELLKEKNVSKVVLRPLMIVAGDHANNDMAGDEEDSWKTILTEDGYSVETVIEGLGQVTGIQDIFIKHINEAMNSDGVSGVPAIVAAGITAGRIKNGEYDIAVDSDTSMFKIVECKLIVADGGMTAVMTMSGQGYANLFMGTMEQISGEDDENILDFEPVGERNVFTVPVPALDIGVACAGLGARSGNWFDHILVFESGGIPGDAFLPCEIAVSLEGGSGKASVQSPAKLTYENGADYAEIVWSSPNYAYMIVDGTEYLPVNSEGNSTYVIPVTLDCAMKVIACTTAMSTPKEIEYTLFFDSSTIK